MADKAFNAFYLVEDRKPGLTVLDENRCVKKTGWYAYDYLREEVRALAEQWLVRYPYRYMWLADSDSGTDRTVTGIRTCPVGFETVVEDADGGQPHARIEVYAVAERRKVDEGVRLKCIGFLERFSYYSEMEEWHFFELSDPATHEWEYGRLVPREKAGEDFEEVF